MQIIYIYIYIHNQYFYSYKFQQDQTNTEYTNCKLSFIMLEIAFDSFLSYEQ